MERYQFPRDQYRSLFNNRTWSDVRFLVDGQTVYGHKFILSLASPVFRRMFDSDSNSNQDAIGGDWRQDVINVEGLSLVGFTNALR